MVSGNDKRLINVTTTLRKKRLCYILLILTTVKMTIFRSKFWSYFLIFAFNEAVITSTHNLWFKEKKKKMYTSPSRVLLNKSGVRGYILQRCSIMVKMICGCRLVYVKFV